MSSEAATDRPPASPPRYWVRYELTPADVRVNFWRIAIGNRRTRRVLLWWCPILGLLGIVVMWRTGGPAAALLMTVLLPLILAFQVPLVFASQAARAVGFRGPHTITLADEGAAMSSEGVGESRVKWIFSEQVQGTPSYILLHWKNGGASIIPRSAFSDDASADAFLREAQRLQQIAGEAAR